MRRIMGWSMGITTIAVILPIQIIIAKYAVILPFKIFVLVQATGTEKLVDIILGLLIILIGLSMIAGFTMVMVLILIIITDYIQGG